MSKEIEPIELPKFWRNIRSIENEIAYQILFAELSFDICDSTPIEPGRGNDLLPYFYNLNYSKGVNALHSILISQQQEEISLNYYLRQYEYEYKKGLGDNFNKEVKSLKERFMNVIDLSIRNKITAHTDLKFAHTDFTSAYILPKTVASIKSIVTDLKILFYTAANISIHDDPMRKIREQSGQLINLLIKPEKFVL